MKAPFRYFGGKSKMAALVWSRLDPNSKHYFEPFAGSLAVLLARPQTGSRPIEIVNDLDGMIVNFFRAVKFDPEGLQEHAYHPKTELDMQARALEWKNAKADLTEKLIFDPDYYDVRIAGYWVYTRGAEIMGTFSNLGSWHRVGNSVEKIVASTLGIKRSKPNAGHTGILSRSGIQYDWSALANRMQDVSFLCGSWERVFTKSLILDNAAVFLDPPYTSEGRYATYASDDASVAEDAMKWAMEHPHIRVAYCGYDNMPFSHEWECVAWDSGSNINKGSANASNKKRERIYFSPACMKHRLKSFGKPPR